jgi:predicted ArsR family transcriptional regulator
VTYAHPEQQAGRHRALSDKSRLALLRVLEASDQPLGAHTLAERVGLHVNTVRWHLRILLDAALVSEEQIRPGGRGRPRHVYRLVQGALHDHPGGFRLLAEILVDALARGDRAKLAEQAGRVRGRMLVRPRSSGKPANSKEAIAEVVRLLEVFGFQPRLQREPGGRRIAMRPCPFGETAVRHAAIVCPVHLGLMRGALDVLGAPVEAAALEPFVRSDLCVAHLRTPSVPRNHDVATLRAPH